MALLAAAAAAAAASNASCVADWSSLRNFLRRAVKVPMIIRILPCAFRDDNHKENCNDACYLGL